MSFARHFPPRQLAVALLVILSVLPLVSLPLPVRSSVANGGIANDAEQVVGLSPMGSPSLATPGAQKLFEDNYGKFLAVYVDWQRKLSITFANSDPSASGAWAGSVKSAGTTAYAYPAGVLVNSTLLRIVAQNVTTSGLGHSGNIVDVSVTIQRGMANNIVGLSFHGVTVLDGTGFAQFPSAILAHNGDILAAWNWFNASSRVKTLRWNHITGSWTGFSSGSVPDDAIVDAAGLGGIHPVLVERGDNFNVYVVGNYEVSSQFNMVFNKATFNGTAWSWGVANPFYQTNAANGIEDSLSTAWDSSRKLVVVAYRLAGYNMYGVFTLNNTEKTASLNTPSLPVSTANYGTIAVNQTSGDYFLFLLNASSDTATGSVAYTSYSTQDQDWNSTLTIVDSSANNRGISLRRTGADKSFDILYEDEGTVPSTIRFARISSSLPPALVANFTVAPFTPSPGQQASFKGTGSGGVSPYSFSWSFGDGSTGSSSNPTHIYASQGMYTVRENVTDNRGVTASHVQGLVVTSANFSFAGAGDWDMGTRTFANWNSIATSGVNFTLALGDFLYTLPSSGQTEQSWCNNFKSSAPGGNVEVLVGNHETLESNTTEGGRSMNKFVLYCPFTAGSLTGSYGWQYYFDYPAVAPLARFIMIDPAIWLGNTTKSVAVYANGSPAQEWVASQINAARAEGIPWIIVGMHKDCISTGIEGCEIGPNFMNFLINERVDLVFQGHDHDYQRSKQLTCAKDEVYISSCVVNDGSTGVYQQGAGTVFLVDGTGGGVLDHINVTDGDYGYFASLNATTWGYTKISISSSNLQAQFVPTSGGSFKDSWIISGAYSAPAWPTKSSLASSDVNARNLVLSWTPAVDRNGVSAYKIYENGTLLASLPGSASSYYVSGLTPLVHYSFQVQAGNAYGYHSKDGPTAVVLARLQGDANLDCKVNIFDLTLVGGAFGSIIGDSNYDNQADFNGDGSIGLADLVLVGANFGATC